MGNIRCALNFRYQALKKCIFVVLFSLHVCPKHVIIVAYCPDFCGLIFLLGLSVTKVTKIKPNSNVMLYDSPCPVYTECVLNVVYNNIGILWASCIYCNDSNEAAD